MTHPQVGKRWNTDLISSNKELSGGWEMVKISISKEIIGSGTMVSCVRVICNLYYQGAKGHNIYMYRCGEYAGNPSYKWKKIHNT
jgi:hypothetical protein